MWLNREHFPVAPYVMPNVFPIIFIRDRHKHGDIRLTRNNVKPKSNNPNRHSSIACESNEWFNITIPVEPVVRNSCASPANLLHI